VFSDNFSSRVFLALSALLLLFLGAAAVIGEMRLRTILGDEVRTRMSTALDVLEKPAADVLADRADRDQFQQRLRDLGSAEKLRLTLIGADGTVHGDSEVQGPMVNHATRPEVIEATETGEGESVRHSTTTHKDSQYFARRVMENGKHLGTIRVAMEEPELGATIAKFRASLMWFGLGVLVIGLVAVFLLARWLSAPIEAIERSAVALAAGDLDARIHAEGPREVTRLGRTLTSMASELSTQLDRQRRARTEIETILASMAEGVVAVDGEERVLLMNQAAAELLGLSAPLVAGAALWETIRFPVLERMLRDVLGGKGAWHGDAPSPRQDGRTLGLSVAPVAASASDESPGFNGAVALLSDVTAIRRLEQVRIDFVANVSHELRTPLAAVMGALETLADPQQDSATRARFLDIANRNAARLQAIVSDLLDLSSIEAEGDRMPLERVRIDAPLRTAASALAGAAEAKGVRLELPPTSKDAVLVNGNSQRLEQVFTNLLENAIKYTPSGGHVFVRVRPAARAVSVDVEDTGIGIPKSSLPRVFERFYRVESSRSRDMGGTGLGLAIVKHVLRAHSGQVSVKSEEGHGSTFTVTLPRLVDSERS
jgi:two-component system phosphate regulon sensor histidine kinase PhoR